MVQGIEMILVAFFKLLCIRKGTWEGVKTLTFLLETLQFHIGFFIVLFLNFCPLLGLKYNLFVAIHFFFISVCIFK